MLLALATAGGVVKYLTQPTETELASSIAEQPNQDAQRKKQEAVRKTENEKLNAVAEARALCRTAVRQQAKFPTEAEVPASSVISAGYAPKEPDTIVVHGRAKLLNSFGANIPHQYICFIKNKKITQIAVEPG